MSYRERKSKIKDKALREKVKAYKRLLGSAEGNKLSVSEVLANYLLIQIAEDKPINLGGINVNEI